MLLLHGYPQTHIAWRRVAPDLATHHTPVVPDPPGNGRRRPHQMVPRWTKRRARETSMALMVDIVHDRFAVVGHDRGARVPTLRDVAVDHSWWGWVDVSHDMMPRVVQPDARRRLFYGLSYGDNGVSFSAQAGRRMVALVAGRPLPDLPIYRGPLPDHPFAPFRRLGQRMLYRHYARRDARG